MDPTQENMFLFVAVLLLLGAFAGFLGGLAGVGGGLLLVPTLVYILGFSQKMAQGTTLALMLPPIGLLATWEYYRQGEVNLRAAAIMILGYLAGNFLGGKWAMSMPELLIRRIFALLLILAGIKMLSLSGD